MVSVIEKWRPCVGHEFYEVSNQGRVRSVGRTIVDRIGRRRHWPGIVLTHSIDSDGYCVVSICNQGKVTQKVHRLVAEAWLESADRELGINHCDGDKTNNNDFNLEYATALENNRHAHRTGLNQLWGQDQRGEKNRMAKATEAQIVRAHRLVQGGMRLGEAARQVGIGRSALGYALRGDTWKHLKLG